jgi:hypothetical protein
MNDDGLDIPECLKVDPAFRGKGEVTTGHAARVGNGEKSYQTYNGRMLPKTMSPTAWEIIYAEEKLRKQKTDERITELKERFKK